MARQAPRRRKQCPRCAKTKAISKFYTNSKSKDGLQVWCKDCQKAYSRKNHKPQRKTRTSSPGARDLKAAVQVATALRRFGEETRARVLHLAKVLLDE